MRSSVAWPKLDVEKELRLALRQASRIALVRFAERMVLG
jgi:hypothetical protein